MSPQKKKSTLRGHVVQLTSDPPSVQDVLDEIDNLKDTLTMLQYSIGEINRKIDELPGEIERS